MHADLKRGFAKMETIQWSPRYSVGVGKIDEQHKRIILMINRLVKANEATTSSEIISDLITQMTQYAQEHLKTEENLMAEYGYPLLGQHKQYHINYRKKIVDLCKAVPLGVSVVPEVMLNFLVQWWQNHILHEDMAYKPFFNEKGVY
jgi:hemerythrin